MSLHSTADWNDLRKSERKKLSQFLKSSKLRTYLHMYTSKVGPNSSNTRASTVFTINLDAAGILVAAVIVFIHLALFLPSTRNYTSRWFSFSERNTSVKWAIKRQFDWNWYRFSFSEYRSREKNGNAIKAISVGSVGEETTIMDWFQCNLMPTRTLYGYHLMHRKSYPLTNMCLTQMAHKNLWKKNCSPTNHIRAFRMKYLLHHKHNINS